MKNLLVFALLVSAALPLAAQTAPKTSIGKAAHVKTSALYECPICHHEVSAAKAKSLRYTCPVDHGKLAPVKTAKKGR